MEEMRGSQGPKPRSSKSVTWIEERGRYQQADGQRVRGKNDIEKQRKWTSVRREKRQGQREKRGARTHLCTVHRSGSGQRWPAPTTCETRKGSSPMLKRQSMSRNVHKGKRQGTRKAKRMVWAATRQKTRTVSESKGRAEATWNQCKGKSGPSRSLCILKAFNQSR